MRTEEIVLKELFGVKRLKQVGVDYERLEEAGWQRLNLIHSGRLAGVRLTSSDGLTTIVAGEDRLLVRLGREEGKRVGILDSQGPTFNVSLEIGEEGVIDAVFDDEKGRLLPDQSRLTNRFGHRISLRPIEIKRAIDVVSNLSNRGGKEFKGRPATLVEKVLKGILNISQTKR